MINLRWSNIVGGIAISLAFPVLGSSTVLSIDNGDQNATIFNDETYDNSDYKGLAGDFDGDGRRDLGLHTHYGKLFLLLNGQAGWGSAAFLKGLINTRISVLGFDFLVADINGDHKDDLITLNRTFVSSNSATDCEIQVVWGRSVFPPTIDAPDLRIVGKRTIFGFTPSMAVGDINGDSFPDIVTSLESGTAYVFYGKGIFPSSLIDVNVSTPDVTFSFVTFSSPYEPSPCVFSADINGDNKSDVILSPRTSPGGRANVGEIDIIWGSASLPSQWNLGTTPPNLSLWGDHTSRFYSCSMAGDSNGDHRADLIIEEKVPGIITTVSARYFLDGAAVAGKSGTLDLRPGSANSVATSLLLRMQPPAYGDFDGDQRMDMVGDLQTPYITTIGGFLTSDADSLGPPLPGTATLTVNSLLAISRVIMPGDINGDGISDLLLYGYDPKYYVGAYSNTFFVFYGYRPLKNPTMQLNPRDEDSRRLHVTLHSEGDPAEMLFSGDIVDDKNKWIPFQTTYDLALTPDQGPKTVSVKFRNRFRRESDVVQQSLSLTVTETRLTVITNRVGNGKKAIFDFRFAAPTRVRARIYDNQGREVRELINQDVPAGLMTVEWDGSSIGGQRVSPGVYILVAEVGGEVLRKNLLVQ